MKPTDLTPEMQAQLARMDTAYQKVIEDWPHERMAELTAMWNKWETYTPSKGHVAWFRSPDGSDFELYVFANGDLYRANAQNCIDCLTGYRIGRWEAPPHLAQTCANQILGYEIIVHK